MIALVLTAVIGWFLVPALRALKAGQSIKEIGPSWHMSKQGTPTMGGIMFMAAITICVLAFPLIGSQIIIGNFFQAIGKARLAIFLSLTRQMLFLLPFLLVLPRFWGQDGVWASLPLADVLSFIVTLLFIRRFLKYYRLKNRHYLDHSTAEA